MQRAATPLSSTHYPIPSFTGMVAAEMKRAGSEQWWRSLGSPRSGFTELKCAMAGGMTLSSEPTTPTGHVFGADAAGRICIPLPAPRAVRARFMPRLDILARFRCPPDFNVSGLYHRLQEKHVLDSRHMVGGFVEIIDLCPIPACWGDVWNVYARFAYGDVRNEPKYHSRQK